MSMSDPSTPIIPDAVAIVFDGGGGAEHVPLDAWPPAIEPGGESFFWVHLRQGSEAAENWLAEHGPDRFVVDALTAEETRPRCAAHGDGALLNLRGVNLNPGAEPEDMVSVRLWIEGSQVVGVWFRPLLAVRDLLDAISRNQAPKTPGELVARLALRLADRAEPTVAALNEKVDELEEQVLDETAELKRGKLADIRRTSIILRRFMFPQRDALWTLETEEFPWLSERDRSRIREAAERVTRLAEELDAIRDRAQIVQDQIMDMRAEQLNRHMLILSIAAAVFLPLGLLSGILGMNVAGMPGTENPWAFAIVCGIIAAIAAVEVWLFRKLGFLK